MEGSKDVYHGSSDPASTGSPPGTVSVALQTAVLVPTFITNFVGNICVCVAVYRVRSLRQKPSSSILASLALSDFSLLSFLLFRLIWLYDFEAACKVCEYFLMLLAIFSYVTILHILLLSCDRYIAIVYPLRHAAIVTAARVKQALLVAWGTPLSSIVVFPMFYGESGISQFEPSKSFIGCSKSGGELSLVHRVHIAVNAILFAGIPILVMLFMYGHIAKISWFQNNRVEPGENLNPETAELRRKKRKEMKWMKTIAIKTGAFTICYVPALICVVVTAKLGTSRVPNALRSAIIVMIVINSALNPIIYAIRLNEFRRAFRRMFRGASVGPTGSTARAGVSRLDVSTYGVTQNDLPSISGEMQVNMAGTAAEPRRRRSHLDVTDI